MAGGESDKKSDLGVRVASAVVMVVGAGTTLWLGGWFWIGLVVMIALGVMWEWYRLTSGFGLVGLRLSLWNAAGIGYIGLAAAVLLFLRNEAGAMAVLSILLVVIATDIGAYFAGRAIGGPKIAPTISPSKTWAGLGGGMIAAGLVLAGIFGTIRYMVSGLSGTGPDAMQSYFSGEVLLVLVLGMIGAICAQAGDFFESWMKRRAGVKDSGRLIPGHGGLFDRVDGLVAVLFLLGLLALGTMAVALFSGDGLLPTPA